ncbi:MAG: hypothetical protein AAF471_09425, partial [Myxococcota bacterium]
LLFAHVWLMHTLKGGAADDIRFIKLQLHYLVRIPLGPRASNRWLASWKRDVQMEINRGEIGK